MLILSRSDLSEIDAVTCEDFNIKMTISTRTPSPHSTLITTIADFLFLSDKKYYLKTSATGNSNNAYLAPIICGAALDKAVK